ncbi:hypothetical protein C5167_043384 [Papaver somniferum]|uniref:Uncharacterized protein n=1 Tax=Papaver somniferum TaxID=3469 RepID=A0A4Y7L6I9_PAPSO|nr:hypothetical protein C5167_043384 [Papaver somniferum]
MNILKIDRNSFLEGLLVWVFICVIHLLVTRLGSTEVIYRMFLANLRRVSSFLFSLQQISEEKPKESDRSGIENLITVL